ncbi:glycosyltransferase [Parvibaculum sedimenti]|uniref:Glycosyltransferase n=1 Tax=Parvibaculum sedimenti TaxID=2608632 RepID=A0A6N6VJF6_9HYPH|nr:glycosyltransferase [Parvibaculum sedimenti]KAB7741548.1 glycosyltransferase [Parvibaculum sedimenti]
MSGWSLLISPIVPDARGNGLARRAWMWAHELSRAGDLVTLVIGSGDIAPASNKLPGRLAIVPPGIRRPKWKKAIGWSMPDLAAIRQACTAFPASIPDRVFVFRLGVAPALEGLPTPWLDRVEIDLDDWESARCFSSAKLSLRSGSLWRAAQFVVGGLFYRKRERWALEKFPVVHISAPNDAAALGARSEPGRVRATPSRIAGPGCPLADCPPNGRPSILFVGTLGYLPNRDAADWLMKDIQPRLARSLPGVTVTVAGDAPERIGARLIESELDWRGYVPDLRDLYREATIAIAPLRGGSGTKIKILEAWFYRRAVVATSHAVRGLGVIPGCHALVADTTEEFVDACRRLIEDRALRERVAAEGHALFLAHHML